MADHGATGPALRTDATGRLPREALEAVDWVERETVRSVWPAREGLLVISDLRCVVLWEGDGVFREKGWHASREYFFFNFAEPRAVGRRHVRIAEEFSEARHDRLEVDDPPTLVRALAEAAALGKAEWARRRAVGAARHPAVPVNAPVRDGAPGFAPSDPCGYCGNRVDPTFARCPFCGAPRS